MCSCNIDWYYKDAFRTVILTQIKNPVSFQGSKIVNSFNLIILIIWWLVDLLMFLQTHHDSNDEDTDEDGDEDDVDIDCY